MPVLMPFVRRIVDEQRAPDGQNQGEGDREEGDGGSELAHFVTARRTDHRPQGYGGAREGVDSQEQEARAPHKSFALSSLGTKVFVLPRENGDSAGYRCADKYEDARYGKGADPPRSPWSLLLQGRCYFLLFRHALTL